MKLHHPRIAFAFAVLVLGFAVSPLRADHGKAADNKIYAQKIVNQIKAENPDLYWVGIHAFAPGSNEATMIAHSLDVIGNKSAPEDVLVITKGNTNIFPSPKVFKLGIMLPLKDVSGKNIAGLAFGFKYQDGDDQAAVYTKATAIRNEVAKKIPDFAALFNPAP